MKLIQRKEGEPAADPKPGKLTKTQQALHRSEYFTLETPELEKTALATWREHNKNTKATRLTLGEIFFVLRNKLSKTENGLKGMGFAGWCEKHHVPRSTAYAYLDEYKVANKLMPEGGGRRRTKKYDRERLLSTLTTRILAVAKIIHDYDENVTYEEIQKLLIDRIRSGLSLVSEPKTAEKRVGQARAAVTDARARVLAAA
jgi:hypothetical protein